jgi:hypothetical protein
MPPVRPGSVVDLRLISCDMRTPHIQHADLGITSTYLRGIDNTEIIHTVHQRPAPMIPATGRLGLAL